MPMLSSLRVPQHMGAFLKVFKYSFRGGFVLRSIISEFMQMCTNFREACAREHPSDDPLHPDIKLNKSADQRASSCSLPPKATVAMAATRLSTRQPRERNTQIKQRTPNEGLNFSTSLRRTMIYLSRDSAPSRWN